MATYPSSDAKMRWENFPNNTYGIEVEFCTHDNQMFSFSHITVCHITPKTPPNEQPTDLSKYAWMIETDADYTFELVSPILHFQTETIARKFEHKLMDYLEKKVSAGNLLGNVIEGLARPLENEPADSLMTYINKYFVFDFPTKTWHYNPAANVRALNLEADYIDAPTLVEKLNYSNWDEDTDLGKVLAAKKQLNAGHFTNLTGYIQNIVVTSSEKHGGLPSSQLNLPLPLRVYVDYDVRSKHKKDWDRLIHLNENLPAILKSMRLKITETYPDLIFDPGDPEWIAKYFNDGYLESVVDEKVPIWHRYWLWRQVFMQAAMYMANNDFSVGPETYAKNIFAIVQTPKLQNMAQVRKQMKTVQDATTVYREPKNFPFYYLLIQKLVCGSLSNLSEEQQGAVQQQVMALEGMVAFDDLTPLVADSDFLQFHYALKDLTSLWFKGALIDVLTFEPEGANIANEIISWNPEPVRAMLGTLINANCALLGWYYGRSNTTGNGFDYDWEEWKAYNLPSVAALENNVQITLKRLQAYLNAPHNFPEIIARYNDNDGKVIRFLQRENIRSVNPNDPAIYRIADWEGRWDTIKKTIVVNQDSKTEYRYLVEHRNN